MDVYPADLSGRSAEPQPLQVFGNRRVQPGHLLLEGFALVGLRLRTHVAYGREDVTVAADFLQRGAPAEPGNVGVVAGVFLAPPDTETILFGFMALSR